LGSLLPFAALAHRENRNTALSVSFRQFIQFILHLQRMSAPRPLWQNETRKLEVFGSFPGLSLTGEMRTPLRVTDGNFERL
jgi:hypothetical protein